MTKERVVKLYSAIEEYFNKNYSIGICYCDTAYDLQKKKEVNRKEMISYGFDMIISIIDFKSSNNDLMKQVMSLNASLEEITPIQLECYKGLNVAKQSLKNNNPLIYEKYYTRKKAHGLPEIVITFSNEEICLYGFPFTLLENTEIYSSKTSLEYFDVLHFVKIFHYNSTIIKRFGV